MVEYGSVKDRKKGWKVVILEMDDILRLEVEFIYKVDFFYLVIVLGIFWIRVFFLELL